MIYLLNLLKNHNFFYINEVLSNNSIGGYSSNLMKSFNDFFEIQKNNGLLGYFNTIIEYKFKLLLILSKKIMQRYQVNSPVLLIFYNRADKENILQNLLDTKNNFSKLFIKVDGPKNEDDSIKSDQVIDINLTKKFNNINISIEKKNLGCNKT